MRIEGSHIIFDGDDALACLHPQYNDSLTPSPVPQGTGLAAAQSFNPYRFMGYFSPGYNPSPALNSGIVTANILNGCVGYEDQAVGWGYLIGSDSKLYQVSLDPVPTITNSAPWPHTITGTGVITGSDVISYPIGSVQKIFYSYNDSGASWNVGMYDLDGATFTDNFMSSVPDGSITFSGNYNPHPMIVGIDNVLYIGDGNLVQAFDGQLGTNGTAYNAIFTIPTGYRITCFARYQTFLCVFAHYLPTTSQTINTFTFETSDAKCFFWDYSSFNPTYVYQLNDNYVSEAFEYQGSVGCFTSGRKAISDGTNRYSRLQMFNYAGFQRIVTFLGDPPVHGGADGAGGVIQWNSNGFIHQWGSPYPNNPVGLNKTATANSSGLGTYFGMCKSLAELQGTLVSSNSDLINFRSGYNPAAAVATSIAAPDFHSGRMGKVYEVTVEFAAQTSGGLVFNLYLGGNLVTPTNPTQVISNLSTVDSLNQILRYEYDVAGNPGGPKFQDLNVIMTWGEGGSTLTAPVPKRIIIGFEEIDITGD